MEKPLVSIIVLNYNGIRFLKGCFDSLAALEYPNYELLFVDNSSTDQSSEFIRQNYPKARIIQNNTNLGFTVANNQAAKSAFGRYLFFLNNDTKVDAQVISRLADKMEGDEAVGICACRIISLDGKQDYHTGINVDLFGYPITKGPVFYAEGSALMIRKELFNRLTGFDEAYLFFHEDVDLAWRARLLGWQVTAVPEAIIYHAHGASAGGATQQGQYTSSLFRRYFSERNNIRTLLKNYSLFSLVWVLPLYAAINVFEILFFLITLQFKTAFSYFRAHWWNIINLPDTLKRRSRIQGTRRVSDREIIQGMYKGSAKFFGLKKAGIPKFG